MLDDLRCLSCIALSQPAFCRYEVDTRPLWDLKPPVIQSYKGVWLPWNWSKLLNMIGQFHDLLLALHLVWPERVIGDTAIQPSKSTNGHENGRAS